MYSLRRSNRKQQTRLTFSPLPSSSPAASDYPEKMQRRAAADGYDQSPSPSKKRRVYNVLPRQTVVTAAKSHGLNTPINSSQSAPGIRSSKSKKDLRKDQFSDEAALPTPLASSQTEVGDGQDSRRSSFNFGSNLPIEFESSLVDRHERSTELDGADNMGSPRSMRKSGTNALGSQTAGYTRSKKSVEEENRYLSDEYDELPLPGVRRRGFGSAPVILSSDDDLDSGPAKTVTPRQNRTTTAAISPLRFLVGGRSGAAPLSDFRRRKTVSSTKHRGAATKALESTPPPKRFMRSSAGHRANKILAQASSDDETEPETPQSIQINFTRKPRKAADVTEDDGDIIPRAGRAEGLKSETMTVISSGSESSDEGVVISPSRKRPAKKAVELSSPDSQNSANDLQEDLDALRETEILRNRTRTRRNTSQRSKRQEQLELLRRRRAGNEKTTIQDLESSADPADETLQAQSEDGEISEEGADSATEAIRQTLSEGQNLNEYADDDGFLDDEEDTIGAPLVSEDMPLEFTRHAHKKPIQHFKDMVEWMIHNKLNPAFPRHDPIYQIALRKLDDEVQGYSGSKFLSSAWNASFLKILKARPELSRLDVPTMMDHKCDACNRSGHPAKHQLIFTGRPYNRNTLENLTDDEDENSDGEENDNDDEESGPLDDEGNPTANQEQSFYLGRTCALNAETAHALHHWRHHLNQYVLNWLKHNGHTGPEKIVERENWSTKRRKKYANKVVDGMEESGEMKILYKEFKQNLDIAREARPERYAYGRR